MVKGDVRLKSTGLRRSSTAINNVTVLTRVMGRGLRRFKSVVWAQRFVMAYAAVRKLLTFGRNLVEAQHYRDLRMRAFSEWSWVVA